MLILGSAPLTCTTQLLKLWRDRPLVRGGRDSAMVASPCGPLHGRVSSCAVCPMIGHAGSPLLRWSLHGGDAAAPRVQVWIVLPRLLRAHGTGSGGEQWLSSIGSDMVPDARLRGASASCKRGSVARRPLVELLEGRALLAGLEVVNSGFINAQVTAGRNISHIGSVNISNHQLSNISIDTGNGSSSTHTIASIEGSVYGQPPGGTDALWIYMDGNLRTSPSTQYPTNASIDIRTSNSKPTPAKPGMPKLKPIALKIVGDDIPSSDPTVLVTLRYTYNNNGKTNEIASGTAHWI